MRDFAIWLKGVLDSRESPSFGRVGAAFVIYYLVASGCYIVSKSGKIPDIPWNWIVIIAVLWGGSLTQETITRVKELGSGWQPDSTPPPGSNSDQGAATTN